MLAVWSSHGLCLARNPWQITISLRFSVQFPWLFGSECLRCGQIQLHVLWKKVTVTSQELEEGLPVDSRFSIRVAEGIQLHVQVAVLAPWTDLFICYRTRALCQYRPQSGAADSWWLYDFTRGNNRPSLLSVLQYQAQTRLRGVLATPALLCTPSENTGSRGPTSVSFLKKVLAGFPYVLSAWLGEFVISCPWS